MRLLSLIAGDLNWMSTGSFLALSTCCAQLENTFICPWHVGEHAFDMNLNTEFWGTFPKMSDAVPSGLANHTWPLYFYWLSPIVAHHSNLTRFPFGSISQRYIKPLSVT